MRDIRRYCENTALEPLEIRDSLLGDCSSFIEEMNASASKPRPILQVDCYTREHFDQNLLEYPLPRRIVGNANDLQQYESGITMVRPTMNNPAPGPVGDLGGIVEWMVHYPLRTLETILNLIDYGTNTRWQFWQEDGHNKDGFVCPFTLKKLETGIWNRDLAVFVVPPWMMRLDDFRTITRIDLVGDLRSSTALKERLGSSCELTKWELLWCYMYDYCAGNSIDRFVLTSYDNWIFGNFSLDFGVCRASVTCPKSSDCTSPSILQAFVFVARGGEHRDVGFDSDTASTVSWESNGTARPLKRKAPPEASFKNSRFKPFPSASPSSSSSYSSRGSGSHRRVRRSKAASLRRSESKSVPSGSESPASFSQLRRRMDQYEMLLPFLEDVKREHSPEVDLASMDGTESRASFDESPGDVDSMDEDPHQTIDSPFHQSIVPVISHWQQGVAEADGHSTPPSNASSPRLHTPAASYSLPELHLDNNLVEVEPTEFSWDELEAAGSSPRTQVSPTIDSTPYEPSSPQIHTPYIFLDQRTDNVIPNAVSNNGSSHVTDTDPLHDAETSITFDPEQIASSSPQFPISSTSYIFPRNVENTYSVTRTSRESSQGQGEVSWSPATEMSPASESRHTSSAVSHRAPGNIGHIEARALFPGTLRSLNLAPAPQPNTGALDFSEYTNYDGPSRPVSAAGSRGETPIPGHPSEDNDIDWHRSEYSVGEASDTFSFRSEFSTEAAGIAAVAEFRYVGDQLAGERRALRRLRERLQIEAEVEVEAPAQAQDDGNSEVRIGSSVSSEAPSSPSPTGLPPLPLYDVGMTPDDHPWPHVSLLPTVEEIISDNISDCSSAATMTTETGREIRRIIRDAMNYASPPPE